MGRKKLLYICITCSNGFYLKTNKSRKTCSSECRSKYLSNVKTGCKLPHTVEWNKRIGLAHSGEKSNWWKGGITDKNKALRKSVKFKMWREAVFKRDDWTCQECKIRGGELHPDHIKPFSLFPDLRFELSNGRTLCATCHRNTPTWGMNAKYLKIEDFTQNRCIQKVFIV